MEINDYLWETLYLMKALHDHGKGKSLLDSYANVVMDPDFYGEVIWNSIGYVFEDTRQYYQEEKDLEVWVFFDPIIQEFYSLCARYERERHVKLEDNPYRKDMCRSLECGLAYNGYDYFYQVYDDHREKCRIVLLLGCEFQAHYEVVPGLLDICEAYHMQVRRLKEELGLVSRQDACESEQESEEWKEAA